MALFEWFLLKTGRPYRRNIQLKRKPFRGWRLQE
jgi:hypothetical protein